MPNVHWYNERYTKLFIHLQVLSMRIFGVAILQTSLILAKAGKLQYLLKYPKQLFSVGHVKKCQGHRSFAILSSMLILKTESTLPTWTS